MLISLNEYSPTTGTPRVGPGGRNDFALRKRVPCEPRGWAGAGLGGGNVPGAGLGQRSLSSPPDTGTAAAPTSAQMCAQPGALRICPDVRPARGSPDLPRYTPRPGLSISAQMCTQPGAPNICPDVSSQLPRCAPILGLPASAQMCAQPEAPHSCPDVNPQLPRCAPTAAQMCTHSCGVTDRTEGSQSHLCPRQRQQNPRAEPEPQQRSIALTEPRHSLINV